MWSILIVESGVAIMELAYNFKQFRAGEDKYKMHLFVAHDGSMIRLAALLGLGQVSSLRWPALGSEIVMEVHSLGYRIWQWTGTDIVARCPGLADSTGGVLCASYARRHTRPYEGVDDP